MRGKIFTGDADLSSWLSAALVAKVATPLLGAGIKGVKLGKTIFGSGEGGLGLGSAIIGSAAAGNRTERALWSICRYVWSENRFYSNYGSRTYCFWCSSTEAGLSEEQHS